MHYNKVFHILVIFILFLAIVTSSSGSFYKTDDRPFDFVNQYGDTVKIYGNGIYKNFKLVY